MKDKTRDKISKYISKNKQSTASELVDYLGISRQALFEHHLSKMLSEGLLTKIGTPPKVFYMLKENKEKQNVDLGKDATKYINDNYLIITPRGEKLDGLDGFIFWCEKNNLPIQKTAGEYIKTNKKYQAYNKGRLIDGIVKFKSSFDKVYLDKIYYFDFYSIERFGKTKLGQMLLYGKQSGNRQLIKDIVEMVKPALDKLLSRYDFDAVAYIPWTVKREVQFMKLLQKQFNLPLKVIQIDKVKTEIIVPQKTLSKIADRIINAAQTLVARENQQYGTVLLIDDAVGSGATLNEVAHQLKEKRIAKKVIGLAITGSFKGFDVISEV